MSCSTVTTEELLSAKAAFQARAFRGSLYTGRYWMQYFVWGSGPPVVFVHGMADAAEAFIMVMHNLVSRFTCVAYELPDGITDGSQLGRYTHRDYTGDLLALMDRLGFSRAAVVGSSFGSTIALHSLAVAAGRITHGILQNGFAHRPLNPWQRQLARSARFWPGWFGDWPAIHRRVMWQVERPTLSLLPPLVDDFFLELAGRTTIRASALRTLAIDRLDLRSVLPAIHTPVLLIRSDNDPLVPKACWEDIEKGLPILKRVEFQNCGHYTHYTHPGPMAAAITEFLT
jgi:pimeloyl-ACP methyl ester carboxylesterase